MYYIFYDPLTNTIIIITIVIILSIGGHNKYIILQQSTTRTTTTKQTTRDGAIKSDFSSKFWPGTFSRGHTAGLRWPPPLCATGGPLGLEHRRRKVLGDGFAAVHRLPVFQDCERGIGPQSQ